jgi:DNA-binding MarR family transcriptional regulator
MEVQALLTLLLIAEHGEIAMAELQQHLGLGSSAMSRNIGKLGVTGYRNGSNQKEAEGLGLVEAWENPLDRRVKLARLTPKGRAAVARALKHIGG